MARPSQGIDQALLRSGLALLPQLGCAGLSVRRVAEHAGVNPAMFHYHFGSKAAFLQAVLQQLYEQMFAKLSAGATREGPVLDRLQAALITLGTFVREHHALVGRLAVDAANGETVVHDFVRANAPRHLGLLMQLMAEAEAAGELQPAPPLQRFVFLMGAVLSPMLAAPAMASLGVAPAIVGNAVQAQVLSDAAIKQRVQMALIALRTPPSARLRKKA
ncbi:MAG TPA: TetR family transcriptional regulator [Ideonella sp.]|uniref:TetR/AcrR family transcriptional regulator n=1 Tax=Ideonella sp. TaxID=1929293 RepID=UPI002E30B309|nr:TetR family transcriptional regulator [Ideonella sp.]HEX5686059.1 TetR family transcriptional regulator [Ideonella sp.]